MRASQVALMVKNPHTKAGDVRDVGRSPGGGRGNTVQGLPGELHRQRSWWATVHGVAWSQTRLKQFGTNTHLHEPGTLLSSSLNAHSALEININVISQDRKSKLRPAEFLIQVHSAGIQATPPQFLGE